MGRRGGGGVNLTSARGGATDLHLERHTLVGYITDSRATLLNALTDIRVSSLMAMMLTHVRVAFAREHAGSSLLVRD